MADLFDQLNDDNRQRQLIAEGAVCLPGFALEYVPTILEALGPIVEQAPFRHLVTPGGHTMSVAMTNCGSLGWVSDRRGYRYQERDPLSDNAWPAMPEIFLTLAQKAASEAGYQRFKPQACLINQYLPGSKMSLHQDKDENNKAAPIVSISLGVSATFLFGGLRRDDPCQKLILQHGDVVVWGGASRFCFHGVQTLKDSEHSLLGRRRLNITFRQIY
ncbi:DNA oxidative demethylase AlkB [Pseudoteredinibacter isoporae]|uniref:Alkylated DNA repair protein (DNA oxidative demethylase) n=1 Tax=Pseudoteredinibacter isoporae TaxID=570281 RepID=A0A7X0JRJ5_9GAMM|nr:DNA oxidative demethylase AlkB [Pseudoteredinibacter isoporae]MBB6520962.1 alkylated DNA repair protein (DNA oxidative demethylase) [Pseudoteredinibacter isoporae]NHO86527.1 DNA oxidative demethylase AlkB [Pseudoteredinibacter isoporae]NIB25021.1 DNA oxidative demethylase AlkB [Pseudoteredinibacter isoporae]